MADPRQLLPLRAETFQILLILADGDRHGWRLVRELEGRSGVSMLPGNFYRLLRGMAREGLIETVEPSKTERERAAADTGLNAERRRYFRLTAFGRAVAKAEARRLEQLVVESRQRKLLPTRARG